MNWIGWCCLVTLPVAVGSIPAGSAPPFAILESDKARYAPSETIRVTLTNVASGEIRCPAAPGACALLRLEREDDGEWRRWSTCEWLHEVERPFTIEPGGTLEAALRRDPALRRSGVETREAPLPPRRDSSRNDTDGEGAQPPPRMEREVEQLIDDSPPAPPFFERLRSLPPSRYRLVTSCAPAGEPDAHRAIRSEPFEAGD